MKPLRIATLMGVVFMGTAFAQPETRGNDSLVGAWHLVAIQEPGTDGSLHRVADITGSLVYTADGHMSVQLMYPIAQSKLSNDYVQNGYEASFGRYDVDEKAHTVTHHVVGANVRALVGRDLSRSYTLSNGQLIIRSTSADEHWSVTWAHDE